jgi:hypothetical protein
MAAGGPSGAEPLTVPPLPGYRHGRGQTKMYSGLGWWAVDCQIPGQGDGVNMPVLEYATMGLADLLRPSFGKIDRSEG